MKITIFIFLLLGMVLLPQSVQAHEGHYEQLGLDEAIWVGQDEIKRLLEEKIIADSWKESATFNYDLSDMVSIEGKRRWIVVFENALETDPAKKIIKIIMTPKGIFVAYEFIQPKK